MEFHGAMDKFNEQRCHRLISGHLTGLRCLCVDWDLSVALSSAWDGDTWMHVDLDEKKGGFRLNRLTLLFRGGASVSILTVTPELH